MKKSLEPMLLYIKDALYFLNEAKAICDGETNAAELAEARHELSNASNAIDDAMGEIDSLLAPERTREETIDS